MCISAQYEGIVAELLLYYMKIAPHFIIKILTLKSFIFLLII
jgi:hypothetical protein